VGLILASSPSTPDRALSDALPTKVVGLAPEIRLPQGVGTGGEAISAFAQVGTPKRARCDSFRPREAGDTLPTFAIRPSDVWRVLPGERGIAAWMQDPPVF
jgi:hypothetical protein